MSDLYSKKNVVSSVFWKFSENVGIQIVQFVIQVFLARILLPSQFGQVAIVFAFLAFARLIVLSGYATALMQKKKVTETDYSSVLYVLMVTSIVLYLILFFTAPAIATFYKEPDLTPTLRVAGLSLFASSLVSVQYSYVGKNMLFKASFIANMAGVVVSGGIGLWMAETGYGVWALVAQQLLSIVVVNIVLLFIIPWKPKLLFSFDSIKQLSGMSYRLLVGTILEAGYINIVTLIVGKNFSSEKVGFFSRGQQVPQIIAASANTTIQSVMFPVLSSHQENRGQLKLVLRRLIRSNSFVVFPIMVGMAAVATPLVSLVFTDKWLPMVPYFQAFAFYYLFLPIHTANIQAINALGRADIALKLSIAVFVTGIIFVLCAVPLGAVAVAVSMVFANIVAALINIYPNTKLLKYTYKQQLLDILPNLLVSLAMGAVTFSITFLHLPALPTLLIQIPVGALAYLGLCLIFKLESFTFIIDSLKAQFDKDEKLKEEI